jgi:CRP/FNR family transcriptional regulator, cyclic AMP receptor protein
MREVHELLRQHPFAQGLDEETIVLIAGCARNAVFQANDYLFREGSAADDFHLIRHGTVALEIFVPGKGSLTFLTVKSGEIIDANWLIPPYRWSYDARAVELTRTLAFDAKCLREKCEADHRVGYEMMKRFIPPLVDHLHVARLQSLGIHDDRMLERG